MKAVTASLRTHLDQEATSMCTCWIIEREDGQMFFFTDHDEDVISGGQTYKSVGAYKRTAVASTDTLSVDNLDIEGITNELVLPRDELIVGLYDRAAIKVFMTRWDGGPSDQLRIRRGFFGQVQVLPNGTFSVELRGLMQHLSHTFTSIYTASCLHDLGDDGCMIPIDVAGVLRSTSYSIDDYVTSAPFGDTFKLVVKEPHFAETTSIDSSTGWWKLSEGSITFIGAMTTADAFTFDDGTNTPIQLVAGTDFIISAVAFMAVTLTMATTDSFTFDDGTNTPITLLASADWTTGVSAAADATALCDAINAAAPLSITCTDDLAGNLTLTNSLTTLGVLTEVSDLGGATVVTDFGNDIASDVAALNVALNQSTPLNISSNDDLAGVLTVRNNLPTDGAITEDVDFAGVATVVDFTDGDMVMVAPGVGAFNGSVAVRGDTKTGVIVQDVDIILSGVPVAAIDTGNCLLDIWAWRIGTDNEGTFSVETLDADLNFISTIFTTASEAITDDTEWVKRGVRQAAIPTLTRFIRIKFTATLTGSPPILQYFDNVYGWIVDPAGADRQIAPYEEMIFRCTTAGTTDPTQGSSDYPSGAIGVETVDGSAVFIGEEAWTRGASVISVTEGSSRVFRAEPQEYRAVTGWYTGGLVTFLTGKNAGGSMEIKSWVRDGSPTSSSQRITFTKGESTGAPGSISGFSISHIDWDEGLIYMFVGGISSLHADMYVYDILTLAFKEFHDLTKSPELLGGGDFFGVDPNTGYLCGAHPQNNSPADDNVWEYVYDPITKTYITINDNFANPASTDLQRFDVPFTFLTHAISGNQAVISSSTTSIRAHDFPSLSHQANWDVTFPTQVGWVKAKSAIDVSDTAYALANNTTTNIEVFEYTIASDGTVSRASKGNINISEFPVGVSTYNQISNRPIPHYDPVTDSITLHVSTSPSSQNWAINFGITSGSVNWITELDWSDNNFGYPRYYDILDGGYWAFEPGFGKIYIFVNLVTGFAEERFGATVFIESNSAFWDDRIDTFFAASNDGVDEQRLIKTTYTTVTIAPGTIELFLSLPFAIEAGDLFTLYNGCDKARVTCAAIFDNVTKMLGAPDVPGQDALYSYPDVKS